MTDTAGPTTLGGMRTGQDARVPGLIAEVEQLRAQASSAAGVAQRALGMVDALVARIEHDEGLLEQLEQRYPHGETVTPDAPEGQPALGEVADHVGDLEGRLNLLAKVVVSSIPGAADQLRRLSGGE
jgi:hypothetical protein